jgi:hypothetical protein
MTEAQWAKHVTPMHIKQALARALPEMEQTITKSFQDLQKQEHVEASLMNSKFLADGTTFQYTYAGMDVYHGGLEKLIGQPQLNLQKTMEWEHKESPYALTAFDAPICTSTLGHGKTFAKHEYDYVVSYFGVVENAEQGRNGCPLSELLEKYAGLIKKASLQPAEVIALRLYTGGRKCLVLVA